MNVVIHLSSATLGHKEKMRGFGLGEGIKRNFTQHPFKMARQILFELLQSRKEISV